MKKTLQISIAGTLFTVEEDAYVKLESYLSEVKKHFETTDGKDEIITDIENRIAEQLMESKDKIITAVVVEKVLKLMGTVEDFDDSPAPAETGKTRSKKLYRNPEDVLIAGVCSGLGSYLGIDAVWIRLVFILFTLLHGFGILLYVILWIIMPEAKTKSQRLEMMGSPVTLETLSEKLTETVSERVEEIKNHKENWKSGLKRLIALPFRIIGKIIRGVTKVILPALRIIAGVALIIVSIVILVGTLLGSGFLVSPSIWIANDIPIATLLPGNIHLLILAGLSLAIAIPSFFVLLGGVSTLKKKNLISSTLGFGLLGIWFISLIISGFGIARIASNYNEFTATSPLYESTSTAILLSGQFERLKVSDGVSLTVSQSATTTLTAFGKARDIDSISARIEDNTLIIERNPEKPTPFCLFCFRSAPELILNVPSLGGVTIDRGGSAEFINLKTNYFTVDSMELNLNHGSTADFFLDAKKLIAEISNGSRLVLKGKTQEINAFVNGGSSLKAGRFEAITAKISASYGSNAEVFASETLEASAEHGSRITYKGNPAELTEQELSGSTIRSEEKDSY